MKNIISILLILPLLSGCAVGMALHGKAEPEITDLQVGMPIDRAHFIMRNYTPVVIYSKGRRVEEYQVQINNSPSAGRALGHLAMDVITWGLWEIVGTPMEGLSSKSMTLIIVYEKSRDSEDWVVSDIKAGKEKGGL